MKGSCLCGAITFESAAAITNTSACHCGQCRKQSGHVWSSGQVPVSALNILGAPRWYEATPMARRGFCPTCGAFMFWQGKGEDMISVALGAIDGPTGLRLERHIFTVDKGDYYSIADGLPQS